MNTRLVIVTGASGAVGNSFIEHFLQEDDTECVAVSRSPMETEALHCQADLLDQENENKLRPYATAEEKKYWLKPETVVERAIAALESLTPLWQEIDVYEPLPGFNPQEYYTDFQKIRSKWQRQTGIR